MDPDQTVATTGDTARETYLRNYETLHAVLSGGRSATMGVTSEQGHEVSIRLERILVDHDVDAPVAYEGETGIEEVLWRMAEGWPALSPQVEDGHVVGLSGGLRLFDDNREPEAVARVSVTDEDADVASTLALQVALGAGGQIAVTVGPHESIALLLAGIDAFDRAIHVASRSLGRDFELLAEGYNPYAHMPLDVPLVPVTRWTLLNAHLGQCGRYARDMMRCTCATQIIFGYGNEREAIGAYQLASALSPLFVFLCDDVRSFRGSGARRCPRMVRSIIWDEVDPARSGIVPDTFGRHMSFDRYIEWLMGIPPIEITDAFGTTTSAGKRTLKEVLSDRVLSGTEALRLFDTVYPYVRLGKDMELLQADSLRPRMAAGYAAFVKGIFSNPLARDSIWSMLNVTSAADVASATHELRLRGWDSEIYGCRTRDVVRTLIETAESTLSAEECEIMAHIAELWQVEMVPRDEFVQQEVRQNRGW